MWSRWSFEVDDKHLVTTQTWELSAGNKVALLGTTQHSRSKLWTLAILPYSLLLNCSIAQWSNLGVQKDITSTGFELQKWFLHQNGVELQCQWQIWLMFVHSADKLAKMRTKFHFIQAKLIMSVWCLNVHCQCQHGASSSLFRWLLFNHPAPAQVKHGGCFFASRG